MEQLTIQVTLLHYIPYIQEFLAATMERSLYLKEEKLYAAFKLFDKDDDGVITAKEL